MKSQAATAHRRQAWLLQHERSSIFAVRLLVALTLALGRAAGRLLLIPVSLYFFATASAARRASRRYLARMLDVPPGARHVFRHFHTFAVVSLDRVFLLKDRFDRFRIAVHGRDVLDHAVASGRGQLLFGAHLGSFEALRVLGRERSVQVNLVMYEDNARNVATVCKAIDPELAQRIIALGRVDSLLKVAQALERGEWVGVLADRALLHEEHYRIAFLGQGAPISLAPFRLAGALRHDVLFMAGLYMGGNRYDLHFEKLIDAQEMTAGSRAANVTRWAEHYLRRLEHYCRLAPYCWFNFYDFWGEDDGHAVTSQATTVASNPAEGGEG